MPTIPKCSFCDGSGFVNCSHVPPCDGVRGDTETTKMWEGRMHFSRVTFASLHERERGAGDEFLLVECGGPDCQKCAGAQMPTLRVAMEMPGLPELPVAKKGVADA